MRETYLTTLIHLRSIKKRLPDTFPFLTHEDFDPEMEQDVRPEKGRIRWTFCGLEILESDAEFDHTPDGESLNLRGVKWLLPSMQALNDWVQPQVTWSPNGMVQWSMANGYFAGSDPEEPKELAGDGCIRYLVELPEVREHLINHLVKKFKLPNDDQ